MNVKSVIEAAVFIAGKEGIDSDKLKKISKLSDEDFDVVLEEMVVEYEKNSQRGLLLKKFGNSYKFLTKPEINKIISKNFNIHIKNPLNKSMLETLAIIAYNEPCTRSKIHELRQQDPTPILEKLIEMALVEEAGRSESVGKPYLYQVTKHFYDIFGIDSIKDLPEIVLPSENIAEADEDDEINFFDSNRDE